MSKVFIATNNCGRAHEADIFSVAVCDQYTITASGDGTIKFWKNKLLENQEPKDHVLVQFVHKTGCHHVSVINSVEKGGQELCIVACVAFSGEIFFYSIDTKDDSIERLDLLSLQEKKKSYWAIEWCKSADLAVCHRFAATDVKGNTYVWKFHPFTTEIKEQEKVDSEAAAPPSDEALNPHLTLQGTIPVADPVFATCVSISAKGLIATGFANGTVVVSQLSTLRPIYTFEGFGLQGVEQNSNSVRDLKFSPLGTLLAVANDSGSYGCVTLYETEYGERIGNLTIPTHSAQSSIGSFAHNGWVFGLSFNFSGEFLATCGYDSKVRVWDTKLRERVATLNMTAGDIEAEEDIMEEDENGDSLKYPPVFDVIYFNKGIRAGLGSESNEGLCCVCMDRSVRWFREAGGN